MTTEIIDTIKKMLSQTQLANLATINEEGKPWTRYVMITTDADFNIRCATFRQARKVQQIASNPEVHLTCGITDPRKMDAYLQIQGRANFSDEKGLRHQLWCDELSAIFKGPDDPNYGVITIKPYHIELMEPGQFEPKVIDL